MRLFPITSAVALSLFLFPFHSAFAEDEGISIATDYNLDQFWICDFSCDDSPAFIVHLRQIASVSYHKYIMDNRRIHEVTLVTVGGIPTKFYYTEALRGSAAAIPSNAVGRVIGADSSTTVAKAYPHINTVEYRLSDKETLQALFKSLRSAWIKGQTDKFTVKDD